MDPARIVARNASSCLGFTVEGIPSCALSYFDQQTGKPVRIGQHDAVCLVVSRHSPSGLVTQVIANAVEIGGFEKRCPDVEFSVDLLPCTGKPDRLDQGANRMGRQPVVDLLGQIALQAIAFGARRDNR